MIDAHCHLNSLSQDVRREVVSRARDLILLDSGTNYQSTLESLALSGQYSFVWTLAGFHPFWAQEYSADLIEKYEQLIKVNKKIVAVGEIGLDFKAQVSLEEQEPILREFIKLAKKFGLPVMIHNRLEDLRILKILDDFYSSYEKVILHCFSYGEEFLEKIIEKQGVVSFSLNILRKKKSLLEALKKCPLANLLLETDSPYMRIDNRESTALDIKEVYSLAAQVKEIPQPALEQAIFANAKRLFNII